MSAGSFPTAARYRQIAAILDTMGDADASDAAADLHRWADELDAFSEESQRQVQLRRMMRDVATKVAKDYTPGGFISTPAPGRWSPRPEQEIPATLALRSLVRERISRGMMPQNLDQLTESRGTVETAAADLAAFTGYPMDACLAVIQEVYR